jgi:hypothetical protein
MGDHFATATVNATTATFALIIDLLILGEKRPKKH